ncbi:MAG: SDR family NAD(P)-dependent oxidoreductase [candidate division Zixibacteria bacterium]|nr:SDR family NAD(P)-dependent oxidoreductase [candidate division Zixibacteria bacterium]
MAEQGKGAVLITGASSGIGRASALLLDRSGYRVFAGVRNAQGWECLQVEASGRLSPVTLDVTDPEQITAAVEAVTEALAPDRGLAGLVNNAGMTMPGPVEFLPLDRLRWQLEVNLIGQVAVTQAFLPLIRKGHGRIVNIGSIFGRFTLPFSGAYAASKFGLEGLTDSLRRELLPSGIHVSIVEPGAIETPIWDKSFAKADKVHVDLPAHAREIYAAAASAVRKLMEKSRRHAVPPEAVAQAILHALEARRPKPRYLVGADARVLALGARFLPDRLNDWLVAKVLRIYG